MKVVCIDGVKRGEPVVGWFNKPGEPVLPGEEVFEGEVYTVVTSFFHNNSQWYKLQERPFNLYYEVGRFVPLSSIDETEMNREYSTIKQLA